MKKYIFSVFFAAGCIALGFMLATGWETPSRLAAESAITVPAQNAAIDTPLLDEEGHSPFIKIAEHMQQTVVNIQAVKQMGTHPSIPFEMFDWGPFFRRSPGQDKQRMPRVTSGGSGIIIDTDGLILTNNHVIADATDIKVKFADGSERQAEVIGTDPETDVALITVNEKIPPEMVAKLGDSDAIHIGAWAIAIGNPFGLERTVTVGVISARGRSNLNIGGGGPSFQNFIQTDASINFGNSGGPLVNIHGEVIGVNTAINAQGQGIGFAIPINLARKVADQLVKSGEVKRGYLGVYPKDINDVTREALDMGGDVKGVLIESVMPDTPAEEGGLEDGDIVIAIDGKDVDTMTDFRFRVADHPPDSKIKMKVWRKGKIRDITCKLGDRSEYMVASRNVKPHKNEWLGIEVEPVDGSHGRQWNIESKQGALVVRVAQDSPADGLLEPGDVIVEIGGEEIGSMSDFQRMARALSDRKKAIPFWVERSGRRTFVPIRPE